MSDALTRELVDYNIDVLLVEPGAFRTNFLGAFKTNSQANLQHYKPAQAAFKKFEEAAGKQPGDPVKAAAAIVEVVSGQGAAGHLKGKLHRLPLGPDCLGRMEAKLKSVSDDMEASRKVGESTNFN